jgi:magnesium-transporting ATPase (P-type)
MLFAPEPKDPVVLSYLALRKAVGGVALGLPFALAIPWWLLHDRIVENSISSYYYTGMRNLFVGSLCAISMFMLCCRGYDLEDEIAGTFSSICALGVAFFPTTPDTGVTQRQYDIGIVHYIFAALLFSTLAYFCLVLFKMSAQNKLVTPQKIQRNRVYTICGWVIVASLLLILVLHFFKVEHLIGNLGPNFCFESTALIAFGIAWLIKGETFLKDKNPVPFRTATTDGHVMNQNPHHD